MKKIALLLLLFACIALPSIALAGNPQNNGSNIWYGSHFNDWEDTGQNTHNIKNWIRAANDGFSNCSTTITYYKLDGTAYTDALGNSTFTHTIPPRGNIEWRPNEDLHLSPTDVLKGSYVINVLRGSASFSSYCQSLAGRTLPSSAGYNYNDPLYIISIPIHTSDSNYLTLDSFSQKCTSANYVVVNAGDVSTFINFNNPSDSKTVTIRLHLFKENGEPWTMTSVPTGDTLEDDNTTAVITLAPHQMKGRSLGSYGLGRQGNIDKGNAVIEVRGGKIVGNYYIYYANAVSSGYKDFIEYSAFSGALHRHNPE